MSEAEDKLTFFPAIPLPRSGSPGATTPVGSAPVSLVGNHSGRLPATTQTGDYLPRYQQEKLNGTRRSTGALKLKKLTSRHFEIIARHLGGQSGEEIHKEMRLSVNTISRILNDPLAKQVIDQVYRNRQAELDAMTGLALEATRESLRKGSANEKLRAVGAFAKLKDTIAPESKASESAEDFAQAIIKNAQNVQINLRK